VNVTKLATLIDYLDSGGLLSAASKVYGLMSLASFEEYEHRIMEAYSHNKKPFDNWFNGSDRVYIDFSQDPEGDSDKIEESLRKEFPDILSWANTYYGEDPSEVSLLRGRISGNRKIGEKFFRGVLHKKLNIIGSTHSNNLKLEPRKFASLFMSLFGKSDGLIYEIKNTLDDVPQDLASRFNIPQKIFVGTEVEKIALSRMIEGEFSDVDYWMKEYLSSNLRANKEATGLKVVISQDPKDIATMSTNRAWTSCTELGSGAHYEDLFCELESGGFVAYLIKPNDLEIKSPLARIWVRRLSNAKGESIAIPEETVYGNEKPGFPEFVQRWIDSNQGDIKYGPYKLRGGDYSDTFQNTHVVIPDDPSLLEDMFINADKHIEDIGPLYSVTDNFHDEYSELFESDEWNPGPLAGSRFIADEKSFKTKEEAQDWIDGFKYWGYSLYDWLEVNPEYQNLDENGDLDEDEPHTEEAKEIIKYLSGETPRFEITEISKESAAKPYIRNLKRMIYSNSIANPDTVSDKLVKAMHSEYKGDYNHFNSKSRNLVIIFSHLFPKDVVDSALNTSKYPMVEYAKLYDNMKEGLEKEELRSDLLDMAERKLDISTLLQAANIDSTTASEPIWDARNILNRMSNDISIPNQIITTILSSFNHIERNPEIPSTTQSGILTNLIHALSASEADNNASIALYSRLIPKIQLTGLSRGRMREMIMGDDASFEYQPKLSDIGRALARTGRAGEPLIPLLEKKYKEIDFIEKEKEKGDGGVSPGFLGGRTLEQFKDELKESMLYIVDSIRTGSLSRKYRVPHRLF
jgi:hypothetical protein